MATNAEDETEASLSATETRPLIEGTNEHDVRDPSKTYSSATMTALSFIKVTLGAGCLTLPYAFGLVGVLNAVISLSAVAFLNYYSCQILRDSRDTLTKATVSKQANPYASLVDAAFGRWGLLLVNVCFICNMVGSCIIYLIFVETTMDTVTSTTIFDQYVWVLLTLPILIPTCLLKNLSFLVYTSLLGNITLLVGYTSVMVYGLTTYTPQLTTSDSFFKFADYPEFLGLAFFAFGLPNVCLPVINSMRQPRLYLPTIAIALTGVTMLYVVLGTLGLAIFSQSPIGPQSNIILNLPQDSLYSTIVKAAISLTLVFTFPLAFFIPADMLDAVVDDTLSTRVSSNWLAVFRGVVRIALLLFCAGIAIAVPDFSGIINVVGSATASLMSFTFPPAMYLKLCYNTMSKPIRVLNVVFFIFGLGSWVLCTTLAVLALFESEDSPSNSS